MIRLDLFNEALKMTRKKLEEYPTYFVLSEIIAQLVYLIKIEEKIENNFSLLKNMTIGRVTAYDIENLDENLANLLYKASHEARLMKKEYLKEDNE